MTLLFSKFTSGGKLFIVDSFTETGITCHIEPPIGQKPGDPHPVNYESLYRKVRLGEVVIEKYAEAGVDKLIADVDLLITRLENERMKREKAEAERQEAERQRQEKEAAEQKQKDLETRKRRARAFELGEDSD